MPVFTVVLVTAPPFTPGAEANASLVKIDGREALLRSVELFLNRDEIKQIQLVVPEDLLEEVRRKHGPHLSFSGVSVVGAPARFGEQLAAAKLPDDATHVLVHDVARPALPYTDIEALLATASGKSPATAVSIPLKSGLIQLDEGGTPIGVVNPTDYVQVVLPMLLTKTKFAELAKAKREPHASELTLIKGSSLNARLSGPADAGFLKAMITMMPKPKSRPLGSPFEEAQW